MRPGDGGVAAAGTKIYALPLFSRAEQLPFKIPVHVPGKETRQNAQGKREEKETGYEKKK